MLSESMHKKTNCEWVEEREEGREERGEEEKDGTEVEWRESYEGEDGRREAARSFVEYYLAVNRCPIWLDSSTAEEVKKLEERIGQEEVFEKTGSTPQRRFSALQVAKVMKDDPNMREKVGCVSLVSSFIASILLGKVAPIDISDGSGMNILDIRTGEWDAEIGHALGIDTAIFGRPALSSCVLGNISAQFRRRYKVSASCKIVAATGDNPSSLAGLLSAVNDGDWAGGRGGHDRSSVCSGGDIEGSDEQEYSSSSSRMGREGGSEERVFISMGTSDTIFGQMSKLPGRQACTTSAHVFFNPNSTTAKYEDGATYMGLVCLSNGSLLREHLREELSDALARKGGQEALSWRDFGEVVMKEMEAKQEGGSAKLDKCILRLDAVETDSQLAKLGVGEWRIGAHIDMEKQERSAEYVLHVLIGQFLLLRRQAENIGLFSPSSGLVTVVGGAAQNEALLQLLANVFDRPIARLVQKDGASQSVNAAALGAAVRSASVLTGRRAYASGLISKVVCYPNMQIASQLFKDFNSIIAQ
uniref:Glycerol kinase n=1 Tax=Palpitomonas bilix TaxID=652834 RepID=A0A7S3DJM2_9EUKA|mmetsp:Transcript_4082/g.7965  ORF Transcript_4082/g.7965 Transcript_4082/m.7965 type:complete len:530 (+) Transcript_4082:126-1715(+)